MISFDEKVAVHEQEAQSVLAAVHGAEIELLQKLAMHLGLRCGCDSGVAKWEFLTSTLSVPWKTDVCSWNLC